MDFKPPTRAEIIYEGEKKFSLPRWFHLALIQAIALDRFGPGFQRRESITTTLDVAGRALGLKLDHIGRMADKLTAEPYENRFCPKGLSRFCRALDIGARVYGSTFSPHNGRGDGFGRTILIVFSESAAAESPLPKRVEVSSAVFS